MTLIIPLDGLSEDGNVNGGSLDAGPSRSPIKSASVSRDIDGDMRNVVSSMSRARRIVVVCGAGVSTAACIPDFRSSSGLYSSQQNGKGKGKANVQDLFHVKCLSSPTLLPLHHQIITELASLSHSALPTPFHSFLNTLNGDERLLRVYTQNIDGLEEKAGLRTGIPITPGRSPKKRKILHHAPPTPPSPSPSRVSPPPHEASLTSAIKEELSETSPVPPIRVVPLHGTLSTLHCPLCSTSVPLLPNLPLPHGPVECPTCSLSSTIRSALSERQRRVGSLRASIILYGEDHPDGEKIGQVVERDLKNRGSRSGAGGEGKVDFLLVCGTSLSVPGVKRIVKEMAKSLKPKSTKTPSAPTKTPQKGGEEDEGQRGGRQKAAKTVLVNNEFPKPSSDWVDVFDVWIKGDVQDFIVNYASKPELAIPLLKTPKTPRTPKKRKTNIDGAPPSTPRSTGSSNKKRKREQAESFDENSSDWSTPLKSRLPKDWLPTPRQTPPSIHAAGQHGTEDGRGTMNTKERPDSSSLKMAHWREGSLTPLSEMSGEVDDPFLDLGRSLVKSA